MSDSSSFRLYLGFTQSEEINYLIGLKSDSDSPFGFGAVAWGYMKNIDVKSLIIGALLATAIFLGVIFVSRVMAAGA